MSENLKHGIFHEQKRVTGDAYASYANAKDQKAAFAGYGKALDTVQLAHKHTTGALADQYRNIDGNTSVRSPYSRLDYEMFRSTEQIPKFERSIIATCMNAYEKVGIVRNIIDLMADFACQGIKLTHRNPKVEKFYQAWWDKINGPERSERFLNMLYRSGNVIAKRSTAMMTPEVIKDFNSTVADFSVYPGNMLGDGIFNSFGPDLDIEEDFVPQKHEIPWNYTILNPITLDMIGEELNAFIGQPYYSVGIPKKMATMIRNPKNVVEQNLVNSMPADIRNGVLKGLTSIPLDPHKVITMFYKKDDWRVWAVPMLYSVLDDLILLEKLKLADLTALDGAIQHIRIWKLGNLEYKIIPNEAAMARLSDILLNNVGGGSMDLIWGPDIELAETSTDIQKFLGSEKYGPVLTSICSGLGIPLTMSGASDNSSYTNNFISLKTLVERLTYGRNVLTAMWKKEIAIVQQAMGFRYPAELMFDSMNISDDANEKALWLQLYHSNLVSIETMQERFGMIPEIENLRIKKNHDDMQSGAIPPKAGPYDVPEQSLTKIALQNGFISPSDVGIKGTPIVDPNPPPDGGKAKKSKGRSGQGRPRNSSDKNGRKKRTVKPMKPSSKAMSDDQAEFIELTTWAMAAQKEISDIVNPILFEKFGKKDLRTLADNEKKDMERFKFTLLYNIEPYMEISKASISDVMDDELLVYKHIDTMKDEFVKDFVAKKGVSPPPDEMKQIQAFTYAVCMGDF